VLHPGRLPLPGPRAGIALAALALTCAGCSHILPLGPAPAAPRHLASAIILQLVLSQPPSLAGGCPAGYTTLSAPFTDYPEVPDACYRDLGKPVTITSAAVAMSYQPASNQQPAVYGLNFTAPAAEAPALAVITAKAFDSRDQMAISTAGKTWGVALTAEPLTHGQFGIWVQSKNQVLQLQRTLRPPA
jgi:hypothetical protein